MCEAESGRVHRGDRSGIKYKHKIPIEGLRDFQWRYIVAGSRDYNDYEEFKIYLQDFIRDYILNASRQIEDLAFITGFNKKGADAMIVRYCEEQQLPWYPEPADWDKYGKGAGFIRNKKMALIGNGLLAFNTGSPGTTNMIEEATDRDYTEMRVILVNPDIVKPEDSKITNIDMSDMSFLD